MSITLVRAFLFVSCLVIGAYSFNSHHRTFLSRSITKLASSNNDNVVPPPSPPSSEPTKKGFGKVQVKVEQEVVKDAGTLSYEAQAKRGVPEYSIFIRPMNGTETEWIPVGSMVYKCII